MGLVWAKRMVLMVETWLAGIQGVIEDRRVIEAIEKRARRLVNTAQSFKTSLNTSTI